MKIYTDLHKRLIQAGKQSSINHFMLKKGNNDIITSETLFSYFIAEHNLPFTVTDHFSKLCKQMFPDSKIAKKKKKKKFSCGKTKTTQIIKRAIAPYYDIDIHITCVKLNHFL